MRQIKIFFCVPFFVGFGSYKNLFFFTLKTFARQACYMIKGNDVI